MKREKVIKTNELSQQHVKDICELLGITFISFKSFPAAVSVYFKDESIRDENCCLSIKQSGEIFIEFLVLHTGNKAVNTIPIVLYLLEHELLFE